MTVPDGDSMNPDLRWTPAGDYTLAIDGTTIRARNAKGKVLKSVPAKVKKTESYRQLETLSTWLEKHERHCADTVHEWFLRGEGVSAALLAAVWGDPSWRKYVKDLVVRAPRPEAAGEQITGMLRDADDNALHLVDLDGDTITIPMSTAAGVQTTVTVPHPILISDIDEWRGLAAELGVTQGADQLFREVHDKPGTEQGRRDALTRYSGAHYGKGTYLIRRSRSAGYEATRFEISLRVTEPGSIDGSPVAVDAVLSIDCGYPVKEGRIGDLNFVDPSSGRLDTEDVGPVTWSEGIRMAEFVYSGRTVEDPE